MLVKKGFGGLGGDYYMNSSLVSFFFFFFLFFSSFGGSFGTASLHSTSLLSMICGKSLMSYLVSTPGMNSIKPKHLDSEQKNLDLRSTYVNFYLSWHLLSLQCLYYTLGDICGWNIALGTLSEFYSYKSIWTYHC